MTSQPTMLGKRAGARGDKPRPASTMAAPQQGAEYLAAEILNERRPVGLAGLARAHG